MSWKAGTAHHLANTIPTVKHRGASISSRTGRLVRVEEKMTAAIYRDILDDGLLQSALAFEMWQRFIFNRIITLSTQLPDTGATGLSDHHHFIYLQQLPI